MRLIVLLLLLIPPAATAQQKIHGFFANGKAGIGNWADDASLGVAFEGGFLQQKNMYAISALRAEEIDSREVIHALDLSYGRFIQRKRFVFHYQAGLGVVWGKNESGKDEAFTTVGLPLKAGIKFVPANFFSIGIDFQANINSEQSLYLAMFTFGIWPQPVNN